MGMMKGINRLGITARASGVDGDGGDDEVMQRSGDAMTDNAARHGEDQDKDEEKIASGI